MSEPTYELLDAGRAIRCRRCGLTSHNPTDVELRYCGHCKLFHESRVEVLLDPDVPPAPAPNFGKEWPAQRARMLARLKARNPDHPWVRGEGGEVSDQLFELVWMQRLGGGCEVLRRGIPARDALAVLGQAEIEDYGPGGVMFLRPDGETGATAELSARLDAAEAEVAEQRRLIINYRNIGMRLATPQTQQWHEILQEAKLAERALYAAVEQPGAGQALLADLELAQALAEATCAEFSEPGATCSIRLANAIIAYKAARKGGADVEQS